MKKLTSLLLAFVMLVGMVPVVSMPAVAAGADPIQGYYYGQEVVVDGKLDESPWIMRDRVGNTAITLLCSDTDLYMGLYTDQSTAALTINGVEAKVDFDLGSVMINGEKMGTAASNSDRGTAELQLSLAAVNLEYLRSQTVSFAMTIGSDRYTGTALLAGRTVAFAENFDDIANRPYVKSLGADTAEVYFRQDDQGLGALHVRTGELSEKGYSSNQPSFKMGAGYDTTKGYTASFTADFNDLVVAGQKAYFALSGFCVDVRSDVYLRHNFYSDAEGNIWITLYDNVTDDYKFDTGFDLPAKNVYVEIVTANDFSSEIFMNGKSVAKFNAPTRKDSTHTFSIGSSTGRRGSDARKTDVMVYDLLVTQDAPAIKLQAGQLASGKDLTIDGSLDEMFWTMRQLAPGTKISALCDTENLYLGLDTKESTVDFVINGTKSAAKLGKNATFSYGYTMGSTAKGDGKGQCEITIPLSLLQLENPIGKSIDFSATAAGVTKEYSLILGGGSPLQLVTRKPASGDGKNDAIAYLDTAGLTMDGQLKENQWYTEYKAAGADNAPPAHIGFLWNGKAMFVGGQVFDTARAKDIKLTLGGKTVSADFTTGTASVGEVKSSGQTFEWRIPFADLGIGNALNVTKDYKLEISNASGTSTLYGNLQFVGQVMVWGDTCQDFNTKNYVVTTTGKYTKWNNGENGYKLVTEDGIPTDRNEYFAYYTLLDFDGHAYELNFDLNIKDIAKHSGGTIVSWRGLCWEIRQSNLQARFALTGDGKGGLLIESAFYEFNESKPLNVKLGDRFKLTIKVSENRNPSVYVNDQFVLGLSRLDREQFTISDNIPMPRLIINAMNYSRVPNDDGTLGELDAEIYSMTFTQTPYADTKAIVEAAADTVTEKLLLGKGNPQDVTQLSLPTTAVAGDLGINCDIKWTAIDVATGMVAKNVNLTTGKITRGTDPLLLKLTAEISYGGVGTTRTFQFQTKGTPSATKVAMIYNDMAPTSGTVTDWSDNSYQYFDTEQNSLVVDQGSSKAFNTIKLYDNDNFSRVSKQHLGVFISDDGKNFTKVLGWQLHQDGKEYTIYNLKETARYVKVHTYHDNWAVSDYEPSFYNAVPKMITVSNEANLPGAGGKFAHSADYVVTNTTGKDQKDTPVFISIAELGAKAGQYKADAADFRFTMGELTLPYWYNGVDGFYVCVPAVPANGSATIKAHWGCSSAKSFSDGEATFEMSYGNVAVLPMTQLTEMGTHGRPWMFPNGDFVVVGRQASTQADLAIYRSTDGGQTFAQKGEIAYSDAKQGAGYGSGFGGFMYNEHTGRLFLIAYRGNTKNTRDYRIMLIHSDDGGETWSEPLSLDPPGVEPWGNSTVIQNYPENAQRHFLYGDGLTVATYDGAGPNIDYVFSCTSDDYSTDPFTYAPIILYSKDDGKTWTCSEDQIKLKVNRKRTHGLEDGPSETSMIELSNGDLYLLVRTQQEGNYYLWQAVSKDHGVTWEQGYSKIISTNSSPCLRQYGDNRILLWTGMNGLGATSYHRLPAHVGITTDDYKTFDKIVDLTFGTSLNTVDLEESRMTQPGIAVSEDGNTALVAYYDNYWLPHGVSFAPGQQGHTSGLVGTMAFRVDQFSDVIHYNKGGFDDFEVTKLKYQGWLCDAGHSIVLTSEQSASGLYSMKVEDASAGSPAHALRQVPSMKAGTVGAKVMIPVGNHDPFALELKAGYNYDHMKLTLAGVEFAPDGTISICSDNGATAVTKVTPGTWNDIAISFDIAADMGKLYVNGKAVSDIKLKTTQIMNPYELTGTVEYKVENGIQEVTCVQFNQLKGTDTTSDCLYVDDFYANELTTALKRPVYGIAFDDVKSTDWHHNAVNFAVDNGVMSGYSASKFGPNDTLTRAMVVQVLYNKEGQPSLNGAKHSFKDVPTSQWYNNAVTWGSNRGVVSGYGGGVFKPEDAVTLEQVAVILWNYSHTPAGYGQLDKLGSYSDWAANALRWAVDMHLLDGVPFKNATEKATRAQTAQILTNYLRNV